MAQISKGVQVKYTIGSGSAKVIPDLTSIPTLGTAPSTQDATTLSDGMKVYVEGLMDLGGALSFGALFTPELFDAVQEMNQAQDPITYSIEFPAPLGKKVSFKGTCAPIAPNEVSVDGVLTASVNITPTTVFTWAEIG